MMDAAYEVARNAEQMRFEAIPPEALVATKRFILDTLGTTLAGSTAPGVPPVIDLFSQWGGKQEATVLVYGAKIPAPQAALVNSLMAHARDFDDTHDGAVVHAHSVVLPAALACAEALGNVPGKKLITAVALGVDLTCRLGLAVSQGSDFSLHPPGFVRTSACGIFAAALACGKLMELDADGLRHAMGIAYSQAGGNRQVVADLSLAKRMQPALAAMAGTLSAFLARRGITGAKEVFEGRYGFFNLYWQGGYSREVLLQNLGKRFEGVNLSFKPYPCCRYTHGSIEATLHLASAHGLSPASISEVSVHVPTLKFFDLVSRPFAIQEDPQVDAQFSIPYTAAAALLGGRVFLEDFEEAAIRDPKRMEFTKKIRVIQDLKPESRDSLGPVVVEIRTLDGKTYRQEVTKFKGSPDHPLTLEECAEKLRGCARFSARPLSGEKISRLISVVENLEDTDAASEVIGSLMVG